MSATADVVDEAERLARVKLSCGVEPGTPASPLSSARSTPA